jgi:hypothetical protein
VQQIMNMFKGWWGNKTVYLFLVLWLHVSLLNLFYVNRNGAVFLWQENSELNTLITHFVIALSAVLFYMMVNKVRTFISNKKFVIGNNLFFFASLAMMAIIGLLLV